MQVYCTCDGNSAAECGSLDGFSSASSPGLRIIKRKYRGLLDSPTFQLQLLSSLSFSPGTIHRGTRATRFPRIPINVSIGYFLFLSAGSSED